MGDPDGDSHVFAKVILNGQELDTSINGMPSSSSQAPTSPPPPPPPPPPPVPGSNTLPPESPSSTLPGGRRPSVVRFNSQPEYFPDYDSLQGSGHWASGSTSPRSPRTDEGSPEPPPPPSVPPPPPPPINTRTGEIGDFTTFKHPDDNPSDDKDESGEVIYSTIDRAKKRSSLTIQADNTEPNEPSTIPDSNNGTKVDSLSLDQVLTPGTLPFSPHPARGGGEAPQPSSAQFTFQGLMDESTPASTAASLQTATALVTNLEDSLNNINMGLFEKDIYTAPPVPPKAQITTVPLSSDIPPVTLINEGGIMSAQQVSNTGGIMSAQQVSSTGGIVSAPHISVIDLQQGAIPATMNNGYNSESGYATVPPRNAHVLSTIPPTRVDKNGIPIAYTNDSKVTFSAGTIDTGGLGMNHISQYHPTRIPENINHTKPMYIEGDFTAYTKGHAVQNGYGPHIVPVGGILKSPSDPQPLSPTQLLERGEGKIYATGHEYWTRTPGNITLVSVDGKQRGQFKRAGSLDEGSGLERNSSQRLSNRSLKSSSLDRQGHANQVTMTQPNMTNSLDRRHVMKPKVPVRNGSLKKGPPHLYNGSQTPGVPPISQNGSLPRVPQSPAKKPTTEVDTDYKTLAMGFDSQIKRRVAAERRRRCCRISIFLLVLIVLGCIGVGLGLYFRDDSEVPQLPES